MAKKSGIKVINLKQVVGDFREYDRNTQKAFARTMAETANEVAQKQRDILDAKTKNPTPLLILTVAEDRKKWWHIEVGPDTSKAVYAWYIEAGSTAAQKAKGNMFKGYHYVKNSAKGLTKTLTKRIKVDMAQSTKR